MGTKNRPVFSDLLIFPRDAGRACSTVAGRRPSHHNAGKAPGQARLESCSSSSRLLSVRFSTCSRLSIESLGDFLSR